jgi:hypothetical protein
LAGGLAYDRFRRGAEHRPVDGDVMKKLRGGPRVYKAAMQHEVENYTDSDLEAAMKSPHVPEIMKNQIAREQDRRTIERKENA